MVHDFSDILVLISDEVVCWCQAGFRHLAPVAAAFGRLVGREIVQVQYIWEADSLLSNRLMYKTFFYPFNEKQARSRKKKMMFSSPMWIGNCHLCPSSRQQQFKPTPFILGASPRTNHK